MRIRTLQRIGECRQRIAEFGLAAHRNIFEVGPFSARESVEQQLVLTGIYNTMLIMIKPF